MKQFPARTKYRKLQKGNKGKIRSTTASGIMLSYGDYGLKATSPGRISSKHLEAIRVTINRCLKAEGCKGFKLLFRIFPHKSITKKAAETRMGSGKGAPEYWAAIVPGGKIICEIAGGTESAAKEAFRLASYKLPVSTSVIRREI